MSDNTVASVKVGEGPEDVEAKAVRAMELAGGLDGIVSKGAMVLLKPNFVAPHPDAVTDLRLIAAVAGEVKRLGGEPVVGESSGYEFSTEACFRILGLEAWAGENGLRVVNFDEDEQVEVPAKSGGKFTVARTVADADVLVNLPKLKMHRLTNVSLGMKNLIGLVHRKDRRRIHARGIERGIVELNRTFKSHLTVVDGLTLLETRAVFGEARPMGVLVAGRNVLSVDEKCCGLLGVDPARIHHVRLAREAGMAGDRKDVGDADEIENVCVNLRSGAGFGLYKFMFRGMYAADGIYSRLRPEKSIIPTMHLYIGTRPKVLYERCTLCKECIPVCPVEAIRERGSAVEIDYGRCKVVRCMKCVGVCPEGAVVAK